MQTYGPVIGARREYKLVVSGWKRAVAPKIFACDVTCDFVYVEIFCLIKCKLEMYFHDLLVVIVIGYLYIIWIKIIIGVYKGL